MNEKEFITKVSDLGIVLNDKQINQFRKYYELLVEWNNKMNLTAITEKEAVYEKHFYDCLLTSQIYNFTDQRICDVGAGAGFPSVPLKIVYPHIKVVIVDSLEKRINFLNKLAGELELSNFEAIASRAEDYVKIEREKFDLVLARAVARLNILSELCIPLVKVDGDFIALKGKQGMLEHEEANEGILKLGARLSTMKKYYLDSDESTRYLIRYHKFEKTNIKYPRNFGQIKKKPL